MSWIKIEKQTPRKGEIIRLASLLGVSRREAFAMYFEFLAWADEETDDGILVGYTPEVVNQALVIDRFAEALIDVGWLLKDSTKLIIPNYDRHNGKSAKKRAIDAERQRRRRVSRG